MLCQFVFLHFAEAKISHKIRFKKIKNHCKYKYICDEFNFVGNSNVLLRSQHIRTIMRKRNRPNRVVTARNGGTVLKRKFDNIYTRNTDELVSHFAAFCPQFGNEITAGPNICPTANSILPIKCEHNNRTLEIYLHTGAALSLAHFLSLHNHHSGSHYHRNFCRCSMCRGEVNLLRH